jgi:hypothetical protein
MCSENRSIHLSVWTLAALVATACGQPSLSPTSPSDVAGRGGIRTTGAVISGTVSDMTLPLTASSEQATALATTPVTVTVVGTNISTTIDGSGRFQLTNVPVGDVQLKFVATGLDATLTLRGVEAGDQIDIRVRISDSSIRLEAERRERRQGRDDEDDDEDEDDDRDEDEFKGMVSALTGTCPTITFTLNSITVKTTSATRYEDGTCARVRNNVRVEVHGRRQTDGSIQAEEIELEDQ